MIKTTNMETWVTCDKCTFTEFAGFNASGSDVASMKRWGWVFGKRHICPECVKRGVKA